MRWIALLFCFTLIATHAHAQNDARLIQSSLDAVFAVDAINQRTTAMYSFGYTTTADEVRWLLPLPPDAENVELRAALLPIYAQTLTEPQIEPPYQDKCDLSPVFIRGDGYLPFPYYFEPADQEITLLDTADDAQAFLAEGDIALNPTQIAALTTYAEQGYTFAAVTMIPNENAETTENIFGGENLHRSPVIAIEYAGVEPVLPLSFRSETLATHLANYDASGMMTATAYIFADVPYQPGNAAVFEPDLTRIGGVPHELLNTMRLTVSAGPFFNELDPVYISQVRAGLRAAGELAFVTELIGQSGEAEGRDPTANEQAAIDSFNQLRASYSTLTRLRTFINEDQIVPDAVFVPAPDAPDVRMDLTSVDGAAYWGCTSRTLYDTEREARLPDGRTYLDALRLSVAHPEDWQLSVILDAEAEAPIYVLSPQPVTAGMVWAAERGQGRVPMFLAQAINTRYEFSEDGFGVDMIDRAQDWFIGSAADEPRTTALENAFMILHPSPEAEDAFNGPAHFIRAVRVALLTSDADWQANAALYQDMLIYSGSYQYFLSDELRHTLFIGSLYNLVALGYPDGWIETRNADDERLLLPDDADYDEAPAVRVRTLLLNDEAEGLVRDWYDLPNDSDLTEGALIPFAADGRRGYLLWTNSHAAPLIEFSAPSAIYDQYARLLVMMARARYLDHH
jgi:hypothetical protein